VEITQPKIINCSLNAGETAKFNKIKSELGLRHDTETFRRILKAYKLESDE
jgi:hypothetical protein